MLNSEFKYLDSLIKVLSSNSKFHICIYDLSGILLTNPSLNISQLNKFHHAEFCDYIKSTPKGKKNCIRCKSFSLKRAASENKIFTGKCYMGLTELVKPLLINGKLLAVAYLGNFYIQETKGEFIENLKKKSKIIGLSSSSLLEKARTVQPVSKKFIHELEMVLETLCQSIAFAYESLSRYDKNVKLNCSLKNRRLIQSIQDYVEGYYRNDIKLEDIAKLHFLNRNYLCRLFKKETGMNFTAYLNSVRIERACQLLVDTDLNIIDISGQVGFENVTYFNRIFKRNTGFSPTQYRGANST